MCSYQRTTMRLEMQAQNGTASETPSMTRLSLPLAKNEENGRLA